jgi:hypothetical protein
MLNNSFAAYFFLNHFLYENTLQIIDSSKHS